MTPEPTGGYYRAHGAEDFVRTFGYPDKNGKPDRLNFGGVHKFGQRQALTGLIMELDGFDVQTGKINDITVALFFARKTALRLQYGIIKR